MRTFLFWPPIQDVDFDHVDYALLFARIVEEATTQVFAKPKNYNPAAGSRFDRQVYARVCAVYASLNDGVGFEDGFDFLFPIPSDVLRI